MTKWNTKYQAAEGRLFGDQPNAYLASVVPLLTPPPQTALCLADGDGRDGTWLAQRGCCVTAVDLSEVGTAHARAYDAAAGVQVERIVADLATWTPENARGWDLITLAFLQCEASVRQRVITHVTAWLNPGGFFVLEGFSTKGLDTATEGPHEADLLYARAEVLHWAQGLTIHQCDELLVDLAHGTAHLGTGHVIRLLGQRSFDSPNNHCN